MEPHDLIDVLSAPGPFVTVHIDTESAVEKPQEKYDLQWKGVLDTLAGQGVDERTLAAVAEAQGSHADGASRFVVASMSADEPSVLVATSLGTPPRRPVVDVSPLPHLLPLLDDLGTQVPHVVVLADRTGADVQAYYDSEHEAGAQQVSGRSPDIRKVSVGGWSQLNYQQRAENGWQANAREIVDSVVKLAEGVDAQLIVAAGDDREVALVREHLPAHLADRFLQVPGGRGQDGSTALVRRRVADAVSRRVAERTLDLLDGYAQERGQRKRALDGVADVVEALRKAQVETLLVTTALASAATDAASGEVEVAEPAATLLFGPDPAQLGTDAEELAALGVDEPQRGALVDVLVRAALATGAGVQLVPEELASAPQAGVGAVLRYADALGSHADEGSGTGDTGTGAGG